jgi:amino-acid N-acetyltransferase
MVTGKRGANAMNYRIRRARTGDVRAIRALLDANVSSGRLLDKPTVVLYEDIQEFWVADLGPGEPVVGCGALHVMWEDLAEIRTLAVADAHRGRGVGHLLVDALLATARDVGVSRVFVLTFAVGFFLRHGFAEIHGDAATPEVYAELLRSYDEGIAEFLDLDRVKPNTLGNIRMLLQLAPAVGAQNAARAMGERAAGLAAGEAPPAVTTARGNHRPR